MTRGLLGIACAVLGLLLSPAQGLAAAPVKGQTYHGGDSLRTFLAVNSAGTRLTNYVLGGPLSCSDGKKRTIFLGARGERPTSIAADGSFSLVSPGSRLTLGVGKSRIRGKAQTSFSGSFVTADQARVSVTTTFRSPRLNCSATTPLTLDRAGTRPAPFRDGAMATGSYRIRGRGLRNASLRTLAPGDALTRFRFATRMKCANRALYRTTYNFDDFLLGLRHVGRFTGSGGFSLGRGFRTRERYRVTIAFNRSRGVYRVRGRVRIGAVVTRAGKRVTTCSASRRFTGRFVSGPKNLF